MPWPYSSKFTILSLLNVFKTFISAKRGDTSHIILKQAPFCWDNCHNHYDIISIISPFPPKLTHLISYQNTILLCLLWILYRLYQLIYVFEGDIESNCLESTCLCTLIVSVWFGCAPWMSCSRTIDDEMLARPVKDTDLLLLGSAHPVPREDCCWRCHNTMCIELAGTVGTSETHSLGKARASSWSHNARNLKLPTGPGDSPWKAGQIMQGRNLQQKPKNNRQCICSVLHMARVVSFANLCSHHGCHCRC